MQLNVLSEILTLESIIFECYNFSERSENFKHVCKMIQSNVPLTFPLKHIKRDASEILIHIFVIAGINKIR